MGSRHERFMQRAIELSLENVRSNKGGPFAAVIARDGHIVAEGANLVVSSADPTAHAEVVAIRRACRNLGRFELRNCEIYSSCEPCPMCLGAIYWARLGSLFFAGTRRDAAEAGFDDSLIYDEVLLSVERRRIPTLQLMREQALEALREWRQAPNKIPY